MKNFPLKLIALLLVFINLDGFSQNKKQCDSPEEVQLDLNSISKCTIEKDDSENKVVLNVASKKIRKRIIRKREDDNSNKTRNKVNTLNNTKNLEKNISNNSHLEIKTEIVKNKIVAEEILFSVVDNVPLFPNCEASNNNNMSCFNKEFSKHFAENFDPERASEEGVSGRVFIQFTIDIKGNVNSLFIKSRKKNLQLESEINRVIKSLPKLVSGKHKGLPVNVKYSLPINFSAD